MSLWSRGREEEGAALIIAISVVFIMIIIGGTAVTLTLNTEKTVGLDKKVTMSQNVAEAGIDDVIAVTVAGYYQAYPYGHAPTMATPFFAGPNDGEQTLTDKNGNSLGTYQVYTQSDPDRPGNVLITSIGNDGNSSGPTRTVKVSVKYTPDLFSYVLLTGAQTNPVITTFTAQGAGFDAHDDGWHLGDSTLTSNIALTGNIGANGDMVIASSRGGEYWGEHNDNDNDDDGHEDDHNDEDHDHDHTYFESAGTVSFLSRDGHSDSAVYTDIFAGQAPLGNQPVKGNRINLPIVTLDGAPSIKSVTFPSSGSTYGHWSKVSGTGVWRISASDFQNDYQSYNIVKILSSSLLGSVEIYGNCSSSAITPTIWLPQGDNSSTFGITVLNLVGPGIRLYPTNGVALLADQGVVTITSEAFIGRLGAGALVFLNGQSGLTSLAVTGNLLMYGSLVVNGITTLTAEGDGILRHDHERSDEHDSDHSSGYCTGSNDHEYDDWHLDQEHRTYVTNIQIDYDSAFLDNSHGWKPDNWWSWIGTGNVQAVKENFDVS